MKETNEMELSKLTSDQVYAMVRSGEMNVEDFQRWHELMCSESYDEGHENGFELCQEFSGYGPST